MSSHAVPAPVGGPILTRATRPLLWLAVLGLALIVWRFAVGLGPTTGLNDGYPWGLWIAFDVVTGTALACGGYAVALLVYVMNKGKYHPLVRPAILASALGYSLAAVAIVVDVGRPWFIWRIPISFWRWNLNSALLEVALCVMAYVAVLWIELSPAFMERWEKGDNAFLRGISQKLHPIVEKSLLWIIALGLVLPTMHQSSLGTVMMLPGPRVNPLWQTPLLPLLFLTSCVVMGYALVVIESLLSSRMLRRKAETSMLAGLWSAAAWIGLFWVALRLIDVAVRGELGALLSFNLATVFFVIELLLFLVPALMYFRARNPQNRGLLLQSAFLFAAAGTLYRFNTYLIAFNPGPMWSYFPTVPEFFITVGMVAAEILLYIAIIKRFPILSGKSPMAQVALGGAHHA
ncbi:MAG: Ni/Fe-hydrogenase cytochrome b subunit [Acidobacteriota bacterium]|jgi:Ni/Fe-hydrogenase subunit HybB-like protein